MIAFPVLPRVLIGVVFAGFVFSGAAFAQSYTVSVIPPPSGLTIAGMLGINNSGRAAGTAYNGSAYQAFIGSVLGATLIPIPAGWTSSNGSAINNLGQVAGYVSNGTQSQAFTGTASGSLVLPLPAGWSTSDGSGINDSGLVAGTVFEPGTPIPSRQGFVGTPSGVILLPLPSAWSFSLGRAVNTFGVAAGEVDNSTYSSWQAFSGTVTSLALTALAAGGSSSEGWAINDSGQVAENLYIAGLGTSQTAIGTPSGSMIIPPPAGATYSRVDLGSINNSGVVVGQSDAGGWIWSASTGTRLLNTMVPSGWIISNAISISNNGRILAQGSLNGGASQYVVLTPVGLPTTPAPPAGLLMIGGLLLVAAWRLGPRLSFRR